MIVQSKTAVESASGNGLKIDYYNCFNLKPSNIIAKNSTVPYAEVTSPLTIDIRENCFADGLKGRFIMLTLKTALPIRKRAIKPPHNGVPKKTLEGKPVKCSLQTNCAFKMGKGCLLNLEAFECDRKRLPSATFAKMTPEMLEAFIKTESYEIINKKGFLRALFNCGLSKSTIVRIIVPWLPNEKAQKRFLKGATKKYLYPISQQALEKFINANGYEIVKTKGICVAARESKLNRVTVRRIMVEHPPKDAYTRTNWARRKTGEHTNKLRLLAPVRAKTLERFFKGNGYEIAMKHGKAVAASACGLDIASISKILHQLSMTKGKLSLNK